MSRSSPTLQKPSSRYFEYKAEKGILQYYDKDKAQTFEVPFPFEFLVLDELNTITGYSKPHRGSHYSNEVRNSTKEPFTIMLKGQQVYHGLYKNEQKVVQVPRAATYTKSIYVAYKDGSDWHIGNLKLSGSSMSAWIEFTQHLKVQDAGKVIMTKGEKVEGEKGDYYPAGFRYVRETTDEEDKMAWKLDEVLQTYLKQYFANQGTPDEEQVPEMDSDTHTTTDDRLPEIIAGSPTRRADASKQVAAKDYPDDSQEAYQRAAVDEVFFNDEPLPDLPPEMR
jgi:hypothetical protein